jgi:hypothetical protein
MDLKKIDPATVSEAGYTFNVVLPDGSIQDATITVRGDDSKKVKDHLRKLFQEQRRKEAEYKRMNKEVPDMTLDELEDYSVDMAVVRTKSWDNFESDGEAVVYSDDKARELYRAYPFLREQVIEQSNLKTNFRPSRII